MNYQEDELVAQRLSGKVRGDKKTALENMEDAVESLLLLVQVKGN